METAGSGVVSKGEFARLINVTPGRVSQYIAEGKIFGPALGGEGHSAQIVVEVAREQLRKRLDHAHRLAKWFRDSARRFAGGSRFLLSAGAGGVLGSGYLL